MALTATEALAQVQQVHNNSLALADAVGEAWLAQIAWMQAVTAALAASSGTPPAEPSASTPIVATAAELAAVQAQLTALSAAFQSLEQRLAALFAPAPATPPSQGDAA